MNRDHILDKFCDIHKGLKLHFTNSEPKHATGDLDISLYASSHTSVIHLIYYFYYLIFDNGSTFRTFSWGNNYLLGFEIYKNSKE